MVISGLLGSILCAQFCVANFGAFACRVLLSWTWPRDSRRCSGEYLSRIGGLFGVRAYWFSAAYQLPSEPLVPVSCLWCGMYRFFFVSRSEIQCLKVWEIGPFFHPARGPFILQAPWREGYGGCRSQGCHGYPSHSARSDSWPHLISGTIPQAYLL